MKKAGLVALSDAPGKAAKSEIMKLESCLRELGFETECAPHVFSDRNRPEPEEKAKELKGMMDDEEVMLVLDVSGGDSANLTLPFIDIAGFKKPFFGYSDLTAVLNAAVCKTGSPLFLFQIRKILESQKALRMFSEFTERGTLPVPETEFLRGERMKGRLLGGNIRCFMKLLGTDYMPSCRERILFLEARSGGFLRLSSMLAQLEQAGVLSKLAGLVIGQTTEAERRGEREKTLEFALKTAGCPVAVTEDVGHSADSMMLEIGREYEFIK